MHDLANDQLKSEDIYSFLLILCVCHTVIPQPKIDENGKTTVHYQASSPDEHALVKAAYELGFVFKSRSPGSLIITIKDEDYEFTILQVNDFNSTRKRMSTVCRTPEGSLGLLVFCLHQFILSPPQMCRQNRGFLQRSGQHHFRKIGEK